MPRISIGIPALSLVKQKNISLGLHFGYLGIFGIAIRGKIKTLYMPPKRIISIYCF
jgi:hypothetical protein